MDTLTVLQLVHVLATVLLVASVAVVIFKAWRSWRAGDPLPFANTLQRPWLYAWVVMGLSLLSFPVTGWWLVHRVGWPLGQTWLLSAAVLYVLGGIVWLLLLGRVNRLRLAGSDDEAAAARQRTRVLTLAGVAVVILISIIVLMLAKPT